MAEGSNETIEMIIKDISRCIEDDTPPLIVGENTYIKRHERGFAMEPKFSHTVAGRRKFLDTIHEIAKWAAELYPEGYPSNIKTCVLVGNYIGAYLIYEMKQ